MKTTISVFLFIVIVFARYGELIDAAKGGNMEYIFKVLNEGKGKGEEQAAMEVAARAGLVEVVDFFLNEMDVDPSKNSYRSLHNAVDAPNNQEALIDLILSNPKTKKDKIDLEYVISSSQDPKIVAYLLKDPDLVPQRNKNRLLRIFLAFQYDNVFPVAEVIMRDERVFTTFNGVEYDYLLDDLKMNRHSESIPKVKSMIITIWAERKCKQEHVEILNAKCQRFISNILKKQFQFDKYLDKRAYEEPQLTLSQYGEQCPLLDSEWNKI